MQRFRHAAGIARHVVGRQRVTYIAVAEAAVSKQTPGSAVQRLLPAAIQAVVVTVNAVFEAIRAVAGVLHAAARPRQRDTAGDAVAVVQMRRPVYAALRTLSDACIVDVVAEITVLIKEIAPDLRTVLLFSQQVCQMHLVHVVADVIRYLMPGLFRCIQAGYQPLNVARKVALLAVKFNIPALAIICSQLSLRRAVGRNNIQTVVVVIGAATVLHGLVAVGKRGCCIILRRTAARRGEGPQDYSLLILR